MGICAGKNKRASSGVAGYSQQYDSQQYDSRGYATGSYGGQVRNGYSGPSLQVRNSGNRFTSASGTAGGNGGISRRDNESPDEKRMKALAAAETRAAQNGQRGGVSAERAKELDERGAKEDLIGRRKL